ncbi:MAG: hypothetical protein H0A76_08650 [Candidatus Thiodubiliella endoseptemdiera]|uniref:Uncharacterized protein n=1 Tax=Candidatus Thiodubiliella endoseptemdiera TaxID=2738886 RepID=A0A853F3H5_9GAMM|nr:hypothetical protein [Candidatus Thiodubiliella endoseptemdiera]
MIIHIYAKVSVNIFDKDQSVISRHIKNILADREVDEKSNMQKMHIANSDKPVTYYSLDIILAVGYRVNQGLLVLFGFYNKVVLIISQKLPHKRERKLNCVNP